MNQKNLLRKERGITLIALVITIIVLLILAGVAISMLSGENGILKQAANAKTETDQAQKNETEDLKSMEYLLNKNTGKIQWTYKKDSKGRNTIATNGIYDLPIGTYINYDPTKDENGKQIEETITSNAGSPKTTRYTYYIAKDKVLTQGNGASDQTFSNKAQTNGWRVLGVDERTGELLIISSDPVKTTENADFNLIGIAGYIYGVSELDKVCSVFGNGYGATNARSVNIDDINRITGYNPNNVGKYDPEQKEQGKKYAEGKAYEYGNMVTYSWTTNENQVKSVGNGKIYTYGSNGVRATYGFNWYDIESKTWKNSMQDRTNPTTIVTLTSTGYYYYPDSLNTSAGTGEGLTTTSKEYETLFENKSRTTKVGYWVASSHITTEDSGPTYSIRRVDDGRVNMGGFIMYDDDGSANGWHYGVRPVVSLRADIQLREGTNGSYDLK